MSRFPPWSFCRVSDGQASDSLCIRHWPSGAKNQVGGAEDSLRGAFVDALALIPVLDVSPAEFRSWQAERFAAKQRDGLGFDLAEFARRVLGVR